VTAVSENGWTRVRRRIRTVPVHVALFGFVTLLAPLWLLVGLVIDLYRTLLRKRPAMAMRIFAFGWVYLAVGVYGLFALAGHWVFAGFGLSMAHMRERSYHLQELWARVLFGSFRRIFRLTVTVDGLEQVAPGPILVLMRHASIVDTLLPNVFVTQAAGIRLRYVLKKELLTDPTLDIAGNRLINHFVDREGDSVAEVRAVLALAQGMTASDGVVIYPEGTRFTQARLQRILDGLGDRDSDLAGRSRRLHHVLPPRPGGTAALLGAGADVVVVAHTGLESLATIPDAWTGTIVGSRLRIRFERFSADTVPADRRGKISWLFDRWEEIDAWLSEV
jgi:1-acyl-sn-glycerol-3-phosphate acyltransferase